MIEYFPAIEIKSRCNKPLKSLGINPAKYMGMAILMSVIISVLSLLFLEILFVPLVFAIIFGFFLILPEIELRKRTAQMETEMPFFLRNMGMFLEMGISFERALELASEGKLKVDITVQKTLSSFAASNSLIIKRVASQLISAYEIGSSGNEMKKIGDELLYIEQHKLKQYSAKSAMFGLMFIISTAIFPTFFLVYAVIGRVAFNTEISNTEVMLAMLIVFPLISAAIIMVSKASMPHSVLSKGTGFDVKFILPGLIFIGGFIVPGIQLIALAFGIGMGAYFVYTNYNIEKKREEIEEMLPDALFAVSGMPKATKPERIFEKLENGFGALSEEAKTSRRQLDMNLRIDVVLDDLWQRNNSEVLKRVCKMMRHMVHTNKLNRLDMLADDIIRYFQIKRERSQVFALQKYTLLFGAVLVPLIMNSTLHLLESMGGLLDDSSVAEAVSFSSSIVPPYLILYAVICSAAIADAEEKKSTAALYFLGMAAIGLFTFHFISL
ncbi:hypothetical protein KKB44_02135 [Candidatus Micrarchaeota archaeon]|nr:hypothetical protein [Candidatus Micrarchaeota archaeon]